MSEWTWQDVDKFQKQFTQLLERLAAIEALLVKIESNTRKQVPAG